MSSPKAKTGVSSKPRQVDWYDTPRYYDLVFDEDTALEGFFLEQAHQLYGSSRGRRCLEPACGSGRLVVEMARREWKVSGNDISKPMLAYARARLKEENLKARLLHGDMCELGLKGRFDLAHCLVSTFKYLDTESKARQHFTRIADLLVPGGIYCLGMHLTNYSRTKYERERWVVEAGATHVTCNIQAWPPLAKERKERMRSRMRIEENGSEHTQETNWWFRTYNADQLRRTIAQEKRLELVAVHDFQYDLNRTVELDGGFDVLLVLRRKPDHA